MAILRLLQLGSERRVDHPRPGLDDKAAEDRRIDRSGEADRASEQPLELVLQGLRLGLRQGLRRDHLGGGLAPRLGPQRLIGADHVENGIEPAVLRRQQDELGRQPGNGCPLQNGVERPDLVGGGKHRIAHQPHQVGRLVHQGREAVESLADILDRLFLLRQLEQRRRIAAGHARYGLFLGRHDWPLSLVHRPGMFPNFLLVRGITRGSAPRPGARRLRG